MENEMLFIYFSHASGNIIITYTLPVDLDYKL